MTILKEIVYIITIVNIVLIVIRWHLPRKAVRCVDVSHIAASSCSEWMMYLMRSRRRVVAPTRLHLTFTPPLSPCHFFFWSVSPPQHPGEVFVVFGHGMVSALKSCTPEGWFPYRNITHAALGVLNRMKTSVVRTSPGKVRRHFHFFVGYWRLLTALVGQREIRGCIKLAACRARTFPNRVPIHNPVHTLHHRQTAPEGKVKKKLMNNGYVWFRRTRERSIRSSSVPHRRQKWSLGGTSST